MVFDWQPLLHMGGDNTRQTVGQQNSPTRIKSPKTDKTVGHENILNHDDVEDDEVEDLMEDTLQLRSDKVLGVLQVAWDYTKQIINEHSIFWYKFSMLIIDCTVKLVKLWSNGACIRVIILIWQFH